MDSKRHDDQYSGQEVKRRWNEVVRHMIGRPSQPHQPLKASKPKTRRASKGRVRKGKLRA